MTAHTLPTVAANLPAWIDPPPPKPPLQTMAVTVHTLAGRRFQYDGLYASTFAAYDDALERHPHASRIEVRPINSSGGNHAA